MKRESDERINTDHSLGIFHLHGFLSVSAPHFSSIHHFIPILMRVDFPALGNLDCSDSSTFLFPNSEAPLVPPSVSFFWQFDPIAPPPHIGGMNISLLLSPPAMASSTSLLLLLRTLG